MSVKDVIVLLFMAGTFVVQAVQLAIDLVKLGQKK